MIPLFGSPSTVANSVILNI